MKVGWKTVLIAAMLTMFALVVGCQPSRDVELEQIASAIEDSNENYSTLTSSVDGINERLDAVEVRINDLGNQVEDIEEQIDTNDERMRTYIATEIHRQKVAIESRIDDLAGQVDDFESGLSTEGSGLPKWKQGTTAEEGRAQLSSCMASRFGILGELMGTEMFSDEDIREFTQDMPAEMSEASGVRMMGVLFGCWE